MDGEEDPEKKKTDGDDEGHGSAEAGPESAGQDPAGHSKSPSPGPGATADSSRSRSVSPGPVAEAPKKSESVVTGHEGPRLEDRESVRTTVTEGSVRTAAAEGSVKTRSRSPTPGVKSDPEPELESEPEPEADSAARAETEAGHEDTDTSERVSTTVRAESQSAKAGSTPRSRSKSPTPDINVEPASPEATDLKDTESVKTDAGSVKYRSKSPSPDKTVTYNDLSPELVSNEKNLAGGASGTNRGGSLAAFRSSATGFASTFLRKRSPFIHNPPQPEERRTRIASPRTPTDYIINFREDLADFQESHGLPRTRDYSFVSLGLALAQETFRAIYSLFQMFSELVPILAIVSLILRFALDKLIEILETPEPGPKLKKSIIFALEMFAIVVPLWILVGTIIIPLISLILSIFKRVLRFKRGCRKARDGVKGPTVRSPGNPRPVDPGKKKPAAPAAKLKPKVKQDVCKT